MATEKLVPISVLEMILQDDNIFQKFIMEFEQSKSIFGDISITNYIQALNDYMAYFIKIQQQLPKKYIDKMNYLNTYYQNFLTVDVPIYSHEHFISSTSFPHLYNILSDPLVFTKFVHFEEYTSFFHPIRLEQYLTALQQMIEYYDQRNLSLSPQVEERWKILQRRYVFHIPHDDLKEQCTIYNETTRCFQNIDIENTAPYIGKLHPSLEKKVMENIPSSLDSFAFARAVYLELCNLLKYNTTFLAYRQDEKNPIAQRIYQMNPAKFSLKYNDVTCNTFSEIYASFLNKYTNLKAIVYGDQHKYVLFVYQGILIKADATEINKDSNHYRLPDITRVKLGLPTFGFQAFSSKYTISSALEYTDKKISNCQQVSSSKRVIAEQEYRKVHHLSSTATQSIESIIQYISLLSRNRTLLGTDYSSYLRLVFQSKLSQEQLKQVIFGTAYKKVGTKYHAVFVVTIPGQSVYYAFEETVGSYVLYEEQIRKLVQNKHLVIDSTCLMQEVEKNGITESVKTTSK